MTEIELAVAGGISRGLKKPQDFTPTHCFNFVLLIGSLLHYGMFY